MIIWYLIFLLFLLININILIDESHETIYRIMDQNETIKYLNCISLDKIIINKTKINSNEIKNDLNYYLKWIQKNEKVNNESISNETIENIMNQTKSRDYLIYRNRVCFILFSRNNLKSFYDSLKNLNINSIFFVFNNETFSFLRLQGYLSEFNQLTIHHKEYPYSICSKDYSNFKCLNDKIKKKQLLSRYYYGSNENVSIELNYQINQTILDNEIKIIKQCNQIDCKINLFYPADRLMKTEFFKLESFPCIQKLDFYLQLIGLVVFFSNIPIFTFLIKIINSIDIIPVSLLRIKFIELKFKKIKEILIKLCLKLRMNRIKLFKLIKRKYLKIDNLIRLILLICLAILFNRSIVNYIEERDYPFNKTISVDSIQQELSIVICIAFHKIKGKRYNIYNRSLSKLEKESDNFLHIVLKDIYLEFLDQKIQTNWRLESKLIKFKLSGLKNLKRCFQLRIYLDEPKYQTIFSITKLIIEFNEDKEGDIYILIDNEIFNSKSYEHFTFLNFRKTLLERSKLNKIKKCKDYNQVDNCKNKWNCIDQCTIEKIYKEIKNLTGFHLLIDKNKFTAEEWSNLFIRPGFKYDKKFLKTIIAECKNQYSEFDPCVNVEFERKFKMTYNIDDKIIINLNYEVIYHKEDESSIFKLLLDLLNIQGNLFGFNFFSLSLMILGLFRLNLKFTKVFKLLIYLICLIGFTFHLWSIYEEIINIKIIFSEYYELINTIQTPDLIFCFDFNQTKINPNYKLTYQYLDDITSDQLRVDLIFDRIEYLNQSNKWIKLDKKKDFQDKHLEINIFYFLGKKCFKITQNINYNRNQFFSYDSIDKDDGLILKIFLNRIYLDERIFHFLTKTKNNIRFSKIEELSLKDDGYTNKSLKIKHKLIKRDQFEFIKNPLSFLSNEDQNDSDKFFNKLINNFCTKFNFVTFKLPINKTNSNSLKELDDDLFIQLYNQIEKDQTNYFRKHSINHLEIDSNPNNDLIPNFEFSLLFYRKVIDVSNKISLIKLIINLLNVLSFWFNLGILDLHNYFFIIKLLPLRLYKYLIIIKNKLLTFII